MFKVDIISNEGLNRNNIGEIQKFTNGITRSIINKNSSVLIDYILNSESDYVLFVNKKEKLGKEFLNSTIQKVVADNDFNSIVSTPDNIRLNMNGKLIPTDLLREYIIEEEIITLDPNYMNLFMYITDSIKTNKTSFIDTSIITYKKSVLDLCNVLVHLDTLEKKLIERNIYDEEKYKLIYIETIFQKFYNIKNSISINKANGVNELFFYSLCGLYINKFNDIESLKLFFNNNNKFDDMIIDEINAKNIFESLNYNIKEKCPKQTSIKKQSNILALYKTLI